MPKKPDPSRAVAGVLELKDLPEPPDLENADSASFAGWFVEWIRGFFDQTQIVVGRGSRRGVQPGDYFVVIEPDTPATGAGGRATKGTGTEGCLLKVVQVEADRSVCRLAEYPYERHLRDLTSRLEAVADAHGNISLSDHLDVFAPVRAGQSARLVPHEETVWKEDIDGLYGRTLSDNVPVAEKTFLYRELTRRADAFLYRHASGYFAPHVLFQKGFALFRLKEYRGAKDAFELFLERYPFNASAAGAREWIEKADQQLEAAQKGTAVDQPIRVLFLASNPTDTERLRLDEEVRAIDQALRASEFRDRFDLLQQWAVRVGDLQGALLRHKPNVVHFSGHGSDSSEIILENEAGASQVVPTKALGRLFSLFSDQVRCVVLNACYSEEQAAAIAEHIDCVVGMSKAIGDAASISFSAAFYQGIGYGRDLKTAFELGCNQIDIANLGEQDTPKLLASKGNPGQIRLAGAR